MKVLDEVKMMLLGTSITQTKFAKMLGNRLSKKYSQSNFHSKLRRETIPYKEMKLIADILGYDIKFVKRENN